MNISRVAASAEPLSADLTAARDATDLIPANLDGIAALDEGWAAADADLSAVTSALVDATAGLYWSGSAANAFRTHRRILLNRLDQWADALREVRTAVEDYRAAVSRARATASEALDLWTATQQQIVQARSLTTGQASLAANADALRSQLQASITRNRNRAITLLGEARHGVADAGDHAADVVDQALSILRDAPLPELVEATSADGLQAAPSIALPALTSSAHRVLGGWSGPTVIVQPPHDGVYDSLSRIAERVLGDARRWPEIYRLNVDRPVGERAVLTNPNLLQPGWVLRLPNTSTVSPTPWTSIGVHHPSANHLGMSQPGHHQFAEHPPAGPSPAGSDRGLDHPPTPSPVPPQTTPLVPAPGQTAPAPKPGPPTTTIPAQPPAAGVTGPVTTTTDHSINVVGGLVLASGVAAALTATGLAIRAHNDAHLARSSARQPDTTPPVVRRLTTRMPAPSATPPAGADHPFAMPAAPDPTTLPSSVFAAEAVPAGLPSSAAVPLGHRDGQEVLIDLAAIFGLGLTGPGAPDAARAVLVSMLATQTESSVILVDADYRHLITDPTTPVRGRGGRDTNTVTSSRVRLAADPSDLLDVVETALVTRTRELETSHGQAPPAPLLALLSPPADTRRLQAAADLGAGLGIIVLVLGTWPGGITCHVSAEGQITASHGRLAQQWPLAGLRVFSAPARDTADLLTLLAAPPDTHVVGSDRSTPPEPAPDNQPDRAQRDETRTGFADPPRPSTARPDPAGSPSATGPGDAQEHQQLVPSPAGSPAPSAGQTQVSTTPSDRRGYPGVIERATWPGSAGQHEDVAGLTTSRAGLQHATRPASSAIVARLHGEDPPASESALPLRITVLGPVMLTLTTPDQPRDITAALVPKLREVVVYLALHPRGQRRESINNTIWPVRSPHRPFNNFYSGLSKLRRVISEASDGQITDMVHRQGNRYRLDPSVVAVDYWVFQDALTQSRAATGQPERFTALQEAVAQYHGELAADLSREWIEPHREAVRRQTWQALATLIASQRDTDPAATLDLLQQARRLDPYHEDTYQQILRMQARLGRYGEIAPTVRLLISALGEIDRTPSAATLRLAARLRDIASRSGPRPGRAHVDAYTPSNSEADQL